MRKISSKADMSTILYERRAEVSEIADIARMSVESWRTRLERGLKQKKLSRRKVSLAAGKGPGYVSSLLNEHKDPTIDNLIEICQAADLSLSFVLYGLEIDRETEEVLRLLQAASPRRRRAFLDALLDDNT